MEECLMCWVFWGGGWAGAVATGAIVPSAGTGLPERYTHADGGVYRGAWAGGRKQGLGTYVYPGGGRYAGEWYNNKKNGRGVYYFPKVRSRHVHTKRISDFSLHNDICLPYHSGLKPSLLSR